MSFLLGVPGKLQTLLNRWTQAKADNVDAAISTRATPAQVQTEVRNDLNAVLPASPTSGSAYQRIKDNLDAPVSGVASPSAVWAHSTRTLTTAPSVIKSIQSGDIRQELTLTGTGNEQFYVDVTITAVNTAKSVVLFQGWAYDDSSYRLLGSSPGTDELAQPLARLTSSTNLRVYSTGTSGAVWLAGRWQVIEFT